MSDREGYLKRRDQLLMQDERIEELQAKYEHAYNALLAEQNRVEALEAELGWHRKDRIRLEQQCAEAKTERDALVEAARVVEKRHKRKVSLNGLLYHEYESEAVEALAKLIDTKEKQE